ncbi:hypothetical protein [Photobacterium sp. TY1-4]|uniref:hypothetical protein n=1 Tax=Photobacterium sp. TY1-4 TaxID=2899122 RepID=UPI0021BFFAF3|nr:hypothetical protein [Photobacterium sp. TY1-4]UXI00821.1 hypothetical protein NH461_13595 [Photobacterium sp. TY1-4]
MHENAKCMVFFLLVLLWPEVVKKTEKYSFDSGFALLYVGMSLTISWLGNAWKVLASGWVLVVFRWF